MNYIQRLNCLRQLLPSLACEGLLIERPIDVFYLTGLEVSVGKLLITSDHATLIVDGRYFEKCRYQNLYEVILLQENSLREALSSFSIHRLGFDASYISYQAFLKLTQLAGKMEGHSLELISIDAPLQPLRLIKDEEEIDCLRQAAKLSYQGYEWVVSLLKEGITEKELAFELEFFWKKRGASGLAFDSIIAFGANSSMPHYRAGNTKLAANTSVLIDIGVVISYYHSDMTRVVFFGEASDEMKKIYQVVEEAKEKALAICRPGTLIGELDQAARHHIESKGYAEYFTHSLGHGIGLEIHEFPIVKAQGLAHLIPLQSGMVITIEPGIYLPQLGGVRLEDTILITDAGYENLTTSNLTI